MRFPRPTSAPPSLVLLSLWLALSGCSLPAPESGSLLLTAPTPVSEAHFQVRAQHTDLVSVRVVFPSDTQGYPDAADANRIPSLALPSLSLAGELDCTAPLTRVVFLARARGVPAGTAGLVAFERSAYLL